MTYLIAGLGNIGDTYSNTRHNIGFLLLDYVTVKYELEFKSKRYAYVAENRVKNKDFVYIKPSTYMNLSGNAVRYWLKKLNIPDEQFMVILDDLALPLGKIRIRSKGGDGGHNGLNSIIECLGTQAFTRLRFGIGNNYQFGAQSSYVLSQWEDDEMVTIRERAEVVHDAILSFAFEGIDRCMTKFNKN